jgi:lipopolysaccharide transport system permease protein
MSVFRHGAKSFSTVVSNRGLLWELTKRELRDRFVGQVFGTAWTIGHPLFLIGLYVFMFNFVFKQDIGGGEDFPRDFTSYLLAGLVPWMTIQDTMARSCAAISTKVDLVKQSVFPLEILPIRVVLASHQTMLISLASLVVYQLIKYQSFPATALLLPIVIGVQLVFASGIALALSSVAVYVRDIKDVVQLASTAGIYLVPVFYLPVWAPALFKPLLSVNPFSHLVWCYHDILYYGSIRHPTSWLVLAVLAVLLFFVGSGIFQKLRVGFGNVL